MQGLIIWGVFTLAAAVFCFWKPQSARVFVGVFFAAMGLGIHGMFVLTNPQRYVDFAANAPIPVYRDIGTGLIEPNPQAFGLFMLIFETAMSLLILSRGRYVKLGLLGAVLFLLAITPLGAEELPNVILAAGMASLLTHQFPTDVLTMLRNRFRDRRIARTHATRAG
jgi:hypothetical protein